MAELLVDTDVFVDHLRSGRGLLGREAALVYSVITRAELLAGRRGDEAVVVDLLGGLGELPVGREVADRGGQVRRNTGLALPDALIAATALVHQLPLLTRNRRHFERVPRLRLESPA
jgi:toxin FitB